MDYGRPRARSLAAGAAGQAKPTGSVARSVAREAAVAPPNSATALVAEDATGHHLDW